MPAAGFVALGAPTVPGTPALGAPEPTAGGAPGWLAGDGKPAPAPESALGNEEGELLGDVPVLPDEDPEGIPDDPPLGVAQPAITAHSKPETKM